MTDSITRLKNLYQDLYKLTNKACNSNCRAKYACCDSTYCVFTIQYAKNKYEIKLKPTGNKLLLLGPHGCIAKPYLRPLCTAHLCCLESPTFVNKEQELIKTYFNLREQINILEIANET